MDSIRLKDIALYAHHGLQPEERELGQRFFLDVELGADLSDAARQDDISRSIDYSAVYEAVATAFTGPACQLLEGAAWRVISELFQQFPAREITVRIRKPSAPINGILDTVEVELCRRREEVLGD